MKRKKISASLMAIAVCSAMPVISLADQSATPGLQGALPNADFSQLDCTLSVYGPFGSVTDILPSASPGPSTSATLQYLYEPTGLPSNLTDPQGTATTFVYDPVNAQLTSEHPHVITYTYDTSQTGGGANPAAQPTTTTYDAEDNFSSSSQVMGGLTTTYTYDGINRQINTVDALGNVTTTVYDAENSASTTYQPSGSMGAPTTTTYDAEGSQVETDPLGHVTTYAYDGLDRRTQTADTVSGLTTTTTYDAVGNQIETIDPLGRTTTYTYDAGGTRTEAYDGLGRPTTYTYDANNQLTQEDPLGRITTYSYDAAGNQVQTSGSMSGFTTTTTYDALDRTTSVEDPLGRITTTVYDATGNMGITTGDVDGHTVTTTYDALNRMTNVTDPSGNLTTYSYDANLNGTQSLGITTYIYDANGTEIDPGGLITTFVYDANYSAIGLSPTTYTYDTTDVVDADGLITTYTYDFGGQILNPDITPTTAMFMYDFTSTFNDGTDPPVTVSEAADVDESVPEPASAALLLGMAPLALRRKSRRRT